MRLPGKRHEPEGNTEPETAECPHVTLVARWDSANDIGHDERASSFHCEACGRAFSLEEAAQLRATEEARLRQRIAS
jgi:hypothetical protein